MSIPVLIQTYDEVRRLAIAGSVVASGDFRLKKLVPQLEQAGQKAPVFARVGEAVMKLVDGSDKTSAPALLELATLVNAILYTQGETGLEGELTPIPTTDFGRVKTQASARMLKPVQEALTTTGSGRVEIVRDAIDRGLFHDLRLISTALAGIDDVYPEIADLVAHKILPMYGQAIVPELVAKFNPKGNAGHVRRLLLLHKLAPETAREHVKRSLDEGSKEVRLAAISCLGESPEDLPFLLEQAKAKVKDVRAAALKSLGRCKAEPAAKMLCTAILGADLEIAIEPLRTSRDPVVTATLLDAAEKLFDAVLTSKEKDAKKLTAQNERMLHLLECLRGREDDRSEKLILAMFAKADALRVIKGEPSGKDIAERVIAVMVNGSPRVQGTLIEAHTTLPADNLDDAFLAATRSRTPAQVFELFSPYLTAKIDEKKKARDAAYTRREVIIQMLLGRHSRSYYYRIDRDDDDQVVRNVDPRWLELAVDLGRGDLVQVLAVPGHARANALLLQHFQARLPKVSVDYEHYGYLEAMIRIGHPDVTDCVIELLKKLAKDKTAHSYYWLGHLIPKLPPAEAIPKLEALLATLPEKMIDQLLDDIATLKTKTA